jgi:hypothetical protein
MPVLNTKLLPVLRFYASLPRTSLLQGIASTGAKWLEQLFIFEVAGCTKPLFLNPTTAAASDFFYRSYSEWRDCKPPRTTSHSFPNIKKLVTRCGATPVRYAVKSFGYAQDDIFSENHAPFQFKYINNLYLKRSTCAKQ